jgi:hypothetical protein
MSCCMNGTTLSIFVAALERSRSAAGSQDDLPVGGCTIGGERSRGVVVVDLSGTAGLSRGLINHGHAIGKGLHHAGGEHRAHSGHNDVRLQARGRLRDSAQRQQRAPHAGFHLLLARALRMSRRRRRTAAAMSPRSRCPRDLARWSWTAAARTTSAGRDIATATITPRRVGRSQRR